MELKMNVALMIISKNLITPLLMDNAKFVRGVSLDENNNNNQR